MLTKPLSPDLLARFAAIVGEKYAVTDQRALEPHLVEQRGLYHGNTPLMLRPGSVAEVQAILNSPTRRARRSCRKAAIPALSAGRSRIRAK